MSVYNIKPQSPKEDQVYIYWAPAFTPDFSAAVLAAKKCINHS
jgi:hypothetical protein